MTDHRLPSLSELDDWQLVNSDQDLRGRPLCTQSGERLGTVHRMLVDRDHKRVAALVLDNGRAVPVDDVEIRDGNAYIDETRDLPAAVLHARRRDVEAIPIVEERLWVGGHAVERGRIEVRPRTGDKPAQEDGVGGRSR